VKEVIARSDIPAPALPFSAGIRANGFIFTAGQVAIDTSGQIVAGGIVEQTRQAMSNLAACLSAAGCSMDDVVKATVFLTDLANFEACNEEYARHLNAPYPARSTVQVGLAPGLLVEIEAVARRPGS